MNTPHRQRGIALLTVLLVFGLATLVARDMLLIGFSDTRKAIALRDSRQAFYYALGGEAYARQLLWQDRDDDLAKGIDADGSDDPWSLEQLEFDIDEGRLLIWVTDLQGRFNLANLRDQGGGSDPVALGQLVDILDKLDVDTELAYRLADWTDEDLDPAERGAEDEAYREGGAAMLVGNTLVAELGELNRMSTLSDEQYQNLCLRLTTLPERTRLNINTASVDVVAALGEPFNERVARSLGRQQEVATYENVEDALREQGIFSSEMAELLTTSSSFFEIEVIALYRERNARLRSVVYRDPQSGKTRIVYRSQQSRRKAG